VYGVFETLDFWKTPYTVYFQNYKISIHAHVQENLRESNIRHTRHACLRKRFKRFLGGDLVMLHLSKKQFPKGMYTMLNVSQFV
jgi:hypothetical protein